MTDEKKNSYWYYQIQNRIALNEGGWAGNYRFITNTGQWCILRDLRYNCFSMFHCCLSDQGPRMIKINDISCVGCDEEIPEEIEITLEMMNK